MHTDLPDLNASRDALLEAIDKAVPLATVRSVYCVGSLAAGLGSPRSDLDLYVFADEAQRSPVMTKVEGRRIDIEVRETDWLEQQLGWFNDRSKRFLRAMARPRAHHDTLARFWYAAELVHDDEHAERLAAFRANPTHCAEVLAGEQLFLSLGILEDVVGFLEAEDDISALNQSRVLLARATQAYLCSRHQFYLGDKWIPTKIRLLLDTHPEDRPAAYAWQLLSDRSVTAREMIAGASCLAAAACANLVGEGQPDGDFDLAAARYPGAFPMLLDWGVAGLATLENRRFQVSADVLRAWQDPGAHPAHASKLAKMGLLST